MAVDLNGVTTVLLPGTGSDDDYVYRAFSAALHDAGAIVVTPRPAPDRLADGLTRSWVGQWPALPDAMDEAAGYVAPTPGELERLAVPMGVAAATDDPVHPVEVGIEWVAAAPMAALRTVTLVEMGVDPAV